MAVSYANSVFNGEGLQVGFKILMRWKGSLYKLLWCDLLIYLFLYTGVSLSYRLWMTDTQKRVFESVVDFCAKSIKYIPISFLLGFFVSGIVIKWFLVFESIPWLDGTALVVAAHVDCNQNKQRARCIRMTLMRYVNLSWILLMRNISAQIASRFDDLRTPSADQLAIQKPIWRRVRKPKLCRNQPWDITRRTRSPSTTSSHSGMPGSSTERSSAIHFTFDAFQATDDLDLVESLRAINRDKGVRRTFGSLITEDEVVAFQNIASDWYDRFKRRYTPEYWVPLQWSQRLVLKSLQCGYIKDPKGATEILKELASFRRKLQKFHLFCSIIIPLAYSQVVTIAVYSYFFFQIFARQFIESPRGNSINTVDMYFPIVSVASFTFLMGWYKVALCVINPFGEDDEDFDLEHILDHNLDVTFRIAQSKPSHFPANLDPEDPIVTKDLEVDNFLRTDEHGIDAVRPGTLKQ